MTTSDAHGKAKTAKPRSGYGKERTRVGSGGSRTMSNDESSRRGSSRSSPYESRNSNSSRNSNQRKRRDDLPSAEDLIAMQPIPSRLPVQLTATPLGPGPTAVFPYQLAAPNPYGVPYAAAAAAPFALAPVQAASKMIKVSARSNVKSVAGAISHTMRSGDSPTIVATGSDSVNQAVKALAIARTYLAENKLDISCQPVFRDQSKGAISFQLTKCVARSKKASDDSNIQELKVARGSDPNAVAGSIANKVRANERVVILSIGPGSVNQTVSAVAQARLFLEQDAIDVAFRPEFVHIKLEDGERSAIKFVVLAQQI